MLSACLGEYHRRPPLNKRNVGRNEVASDFFNVGRYLTTLLRNPGELARAEDLPNLGLMPALMQCDDPQHLHILDIQVDRFDALLWILAREQQGEIRLFIVRIVRWVGHPG